MTNEEKAREMFPDMPTLIPLCIGIREKLVEMAKWKDAQFKEYLEKKRVELFNSNCLSVEPYIDFIDEIINELLPNTEQDNTDRDE